MRPRFVQSRLVRSLFERSGTTKSLVAAACGSAVGLALAAHAAAAWSGATVLWNAGLVAALAASHLLLISYGLTVSRVAIDRDHPFGHARDYYFWTYITGLVIWPAVAVSVAMSGFDAILTPRALVINPWLHLALLLCAVCALLLAMAAGKELAARKDRDTLAAALRSPDDPGLHSLVIDTSALAAAITLAFVGVAAHDLAGWRTTDGFATAGLGLAAIGATVAYALHVQIVLSGRSASSADEEGMRRIAAEEAGPGLTLTAMDDLRTVQIGPNELLVLIDVKFADAVSAERAAGAAARLGRAIRARYPQVRRVVFESRAFDPTRNLVVLPSSARPARPSSPPADAKAPNSPPNGDKR